MAYLPAGTMLPAISLWQPWASLTAYGRRFETRRGKPRKAGVIGKRVAIHAGTRLIGKGLDGRPLTEQFRSAVAKFLGNPNWTSELSRGAYVATAELIGAFECGEQFIGPDGKPMVEIVGRTADSDPSVAAIQTDEFGDFLRGRWVWQFSATCPIVPPFRAKGFQDWWSWQILESLAVG